MAVGLVSQSDPMAVWVTLIGLRWSHSETQDRVLVVVLVLVLNHYTAKLTSLNYSNSFSTIRLWPEDKIFCSF